MVYVTQSFIQHDAINEHYQNNHPVSNNRNNSVINQNRNEDEDDNEDEMTITKTIRRRRKIQNNADRSCNIIVRYVEEVSEEK